MASESEPSQASNGQTPSLPDTHKEAGLQGIVGRLAKTLERDTLVQQIVSQLRQSLQVDRVVLYYFYSQWQGRVTFESLSYPDLSILGSTGPDDCFNDQYASLYLAGRVRAIADIEQDDLHACHRDFLRNMQVKSNLVVPIVVNQQLWGLLIAHHCQAPHPWTDQDIALLQQGATRLTQASTIQNS